MIGELVTAGTKLAVVLATIAVLMVISRPIVWIHEWCHAAVAHRYGFSTEIETGHGFGQTLIYPSEWVVTRPSRQFRNISLAPMALIPLGAAIGALGWWLTTHVGPLSSPIGIAGAALVVAGVPSPPDIWIAIRPEFLRRQDHGLQLAIDDAHGPHRAAHGIEWSSSIVVTEVSSGA